MNIITFAYGVAVMFQFMDYVYAVYQEKSFTAAAKNLFISQPALSASIKKLEGQLGVTLFDRTASPVRLTPAGEAYIEAVQEVYRIRRELEEKLNDISKLKTGHLVVSGANFISSFVLPEILMAFAGEYPGIQVQMVESNSPSLTEQLLSEEIDLLIDYHPDEKLCVSYPLLSEEILLCVPSGWAVNEQLGHFALSAGEIQRRQGPKRPGVQLQMFSQQKFLLLKPGNDMNRRALQLCKNSGFVPEASLYLDQLMTSYNLAKAGLGIAFVTDTLVHNIEDSGTCLFYRLAQENARRTLFLAHKRNRYLTLAARAFIGTALRVYGGRAAQDGAVI